MIASLQYYCLTINIEKVYRHMREHQILHDRNQRPSKKYVKYSRVYPNNPRLFWIWMWASDQSRYTFILTLIDCFTRKVPYWEIAFSVKSDQVKKAWE